MDIQDVAFRACADPELVASIMFQIVHRMSEQGSQWVSLPVKRKKSGDVLTVLENMGVIESKTLNNCYFAEGQWVRRQATTYYRINPVYNATDLADYTLTNQSLINSLIKFARLHQRKWISKAN